MYADNVLGDGAPSKPVEVDVRAFLGHLRAQEHQQHAAPSMGQAPFARSQGLGHPLVSTTRLASADGVSDLVAGDNAASLCAKPPGLAVESEDSHQQEGRVEPSIEAGRDAQGVILQSSASSPPAAFDGDFMGLGGFGEDLVDNLFAPPSSSRRRRLHGRRHLCAPAAGGTTGAHLFEREGDTRADGPYPLPPIVLAAGISGESRAENVAGTHEQRSNEKLAPGGGERDCGNRRRGVATAGVQSRLHGRSSDSVNNTTTNDVFHAFIDVGRRLPGRLRR